MFLLLLHLLGVHPIHNDPGDILVGRVQTLSPIGYCMHQSISFGTLNGNNPVMRKLSLYEPRRRP